MILPVAVAGRMRFYMVFLSISPSRKLWEEHESRFLPFRVFKRGNLAVLLDIWFGKRIYEAGNGWVHAEKGCSACAGC
ncbi:MAG: hypothetical protein ACLT8E_08300 [Akkermansia sp.]